jgi:hypothetical protein
MRSGFCYRCTQHNAKILLVALTLVCLSYSCDESLPPRSDPTMLFVADLESLYSISVTSNQLFLKVNVKNIYDETIQDAEGISGTLEITLRRDSRYRKTVQFSRANLLTVSAYNSATDQLTVNSGETIELRYEWDFSTDAQGGSSGEFFHYYPDPECPLRQFAYREVFTVQGTVQLFKTVGDVRFGPVDVPLCYISGWVNPRDCPPIVGTFECKTQ